MGCTKESHVSTIATLTPFLPSPSTIPASSDIVLTLFTSDPNDFLLSLPNCTCPQGSAFWNSHTVRLCSSFSTTEFILLFLQLSTLPKFFISSGSWTFVRGGSTFNAICPIPSLSPSSRSRNSFHFPASANIYIYVLRITNLKPFCLHYQCTLHIQLA